MPKRHLLSLVDLTPSEISYLIDRTLSLASGQAETKQLLKGNAIGIYFRKTSTRTRTAFTLGAQKLGASVIIYGSGDLQINTGETIGDTTRVLAGYLDALVLRTADSVDEMKIFANQDNMAVINAMSDKEHPTQALSDLAMLKKHFGHLDNLHVLYFGEGNSTAVALMLAISKVPRMRLTLYTPEGYGLPEEFTNSAQVFAHKWGAQIDEYHQLDHLPEHVDVVYTTRWQTTGSTKSDPDWKQYFKPFSVTQAMMERVSRPSGTIFLHDLPAVRGEEVSSEVLDGSQSMVFHQAQNKLFSAMAVLEWCIVGRFPEQG